MSKIEKLRKAWNRINQQCYNSKVSNYKYYGGKGVKVEWLTFDEFYQDMSKSYKDGLFLGRINKSDNYSLENCKWVNRIELHNNKCNQHLLTIKGVTKKLSDWARESGVEPALLINRINHKACKSDLLQPKHNRGNYVTIGNKTQIIADWCRELNISYDNVRSRRRVQKWSVEKALTTPTRKHIKSNQAHKALMIEKDGIKDSFSGWCRRLGISMNAVYYRMQKHNIGITKALFDFEKFGRGV